MNRSIKLFVVLSFSLIHLSLIAQINDSVKWTPKFLRIDSVVKRLEIKYKVRIFYNPAWYEDKEIQPEITNQPIEDALKLLARISNLNYLKLRDDYYVIVPTSMVSDNNLRENQDFYTIGDMAKYGSQPNASITGTVINGSTSDALAGAILTLTDLNKSVSTDRNGNYQMNIPVGEHNLKISYPGFEERSIKIKAFSNGTLPVELYVKSIMLNEVSVTSVKIDQYYRRTKMSVMNLDAKSIKQLPSNFGETDIIKSLSLLPGVQTTGEFGSGFNVRGGSSDQNLVLLEEVPVFNSSHLFGLVSVINADGISDVTLYKGGLPASYGERASSILSVKSGVEDLKRTRVRGGIGLLNSRLSLEVPYKDKVQFIMGGRTSYSDWMLGKIPDQDLMNSSAMFNDFNIYFKYDISKKDNITVFGYTSNDKFSLSGINNYKYGNFLGSINYSHRFNSKLFTNFLLGISKYEAQMTENDSLQPTNAYKTKNSILYRSLKWNLIYKLYEKHIITFGVNGIHYEINPGERSPFDENSLVLSDKTENENGIEWAGFISDDIKLNDKLSIEAGIRISGFSYLGAKTVYLYNPEIPRNQSSIIDSVRYKQWAHIKTWSGP
ncbi:MAG: TonB-dependent receptor, partial [Bacteroidales bacterium]|nr:TonB-dependent receptor [Bacteroidales bacterium]